MTQSRSCSRARWWAIGLVLAACWGAAAAQEARSTRLVVPAPPGGAMDATARLLAQRLGALTGESYVVDNRPGAATQIAAEHVARSAPDGRVLLFAGGGVALVPFVMKTSFSPLDELVPVVQFTQEHFVLVTHPGSGITSAHDLQAAAAARPHGLSCVAPPGPPSIACDQLKARMGGAVVPAPYAGVAPALNALLGGHVDLMFVNLEAAAKLVAAGRVRLLAQSEGAGIAQVPTVNAVWPGFLLDSHFGVMAPVGTPEARIRQVNADVNRLLSDPQLVAQLTRDGAQLPVGGTPERYGAAMRRTSDRYGALIRQLGLGPREK